MMIKRILAFLLSAVCIVACIGVCCVICNHPSEAIENTVSSFYREPAGTLDAVMIGSSGVEMGFYPSVLWKKAQITSYCFVVDGCSCNVYPSMLKEVLSKQPQAMLLVDIDGFLADDVFQKEKDPVRFWVDSMPKNKNWYQTVRTLCKEDFFERLFPFSRYHRYMTSLYAYIPITARSLKKQILGIRDPMKGALRDTSVSGKELKMLNTHDLAPQPISNLSETYFEEFIALCKAESIQNVLFVDMPKTYAEEKNLQRNLRYGVRVNYLREKIEPLGYKVFSYNAMQNPAKLDLQTDFKDTLHLNTKGAEKFSEYFANYLQANYDFPKKDAALAAQWDADVARITD